MKVAIFDSRLRLAEAAADEAASIVRQAIAERRQALAATEELSGSDHDERAGLLSSIKRFFGMK